MLFLSAQTHSPFSWSTVHSSFAWRNYPFPQGMSSTGIKIKLPLFLMIRVSK